jgi:hypothetical protein
MGMALERNTITASALGLRPDVRMVNAAVRARLGMVRVGDAELLDTRKQPVNLRLRGEARYTHLENHSIPLHASMGVWYFEKGGTRFHGGYETVADMCGGAEKGSDAWLEMVFDRAATVQKELGLPVSLQAHYPNEIGSQNVSKWVKMMEQTGIGVDSIVPFLFGDKIYQHGSLTNYNKGVREHARQRQLETFQMASLLGIPTVNHWLGIDGFENPMAQDTTWMNDQIEGATADSMNEVPGQQGTEEPKPYEPRKNNIMALTHDGLFRGMGIEKRLTGANRVYLDQGFRMVGMTPEIGHMKMGSEVLGKSFEMVLSEGRLFCIHWNGQPDGNYDVDGNPGLDNFETLDHIAYVLQRAGYQGVHTLDINPLRMNLVSAAMIGFMNLGAAFDAAKAADHRLIEAAVTNPEKDGNAILELYQLAQRRPGTVWAERATERVGRMAEGLQVSDLG